MSGWECEAIKRMKQHFHLFDTNKYWRWEEIEWAHAAIAAQIRHLPPPDLPKHFPRDQTVGPGCNTRSAQCLRHWQHGVQVKLGPPTPGPFWKENVRGEWAFVDCFINRKVWSTNSMFCSFADTKLETYLTIYGSKVFLLSGEKVFWKLCLLKGEDI